MEPSNLPARAFIVGYGSRLVPRMPFEVARLPTGDRIVFAHNGGERSIMVAPGVEGAAFALGRDTRELGEVLDFVEEEPSPPGWRICTRSYCAEWPERTRLWSTPYEASWPFELSIEAGESDEYVKVEGPFLHGQCPALEAFVIDGMRAGARGRLHDACEWLDILYDLEGIPWVQRRHLLTTPQGDLLVTAQGPDGASAASNAAAIVARTLTLRA